MNDVMYKLYDVEVKKLNDLTYEFVASTEEIDRDGEIIEMAGWDLRNFKKNPVITYAHDYRSLPIGKSPKIWVSEGKLRNYVEFPAEGVYPFADTVRRLVDGGFLRTESVGFKPAPNSVIVEGGDGVKTPTRRYTKQELLEIAIVPVPTNPNALAEAKAKGLITEAEFEELVTKPEETEDYIRVPVPKEEGKHEGHRIRTIDIDKDKGIKALYCGQDKVIITYLFVKEGHSWTMESAQAWVREHGKAASQAEIADELDYILSLLGEGLNEKAKVKAWELVSEVMRLSGSDMPVNITAKIGAVLNQKNKGRLQEIKELAQEILDSAEHEEEPKEAEPALLNPVEVAKIVVQELARIRGKIN